MLTIYDVTSATDAKNYYASSVSPGALSSRKDYYSEGQETPGRYTGKLAEELDLAGKAVDQETFFRLCDNLHPSEDRPLTPRTNDYRRVCKDFTFSGPKSFSIIEAFAPDDDVRKELRRVFDEAINETVAEDIEPDMACRERADGADHDIVTGNALAAGLDHFTSRAENDDSLPDMHYHRHLLIWNATKRPDGRIMAAQMGNIVRDKGYYRAAFYARLADKLVNDLGIPLDRRDGYEWEVAGVPQSMIDKFSKRTHQIEDEADRRGITDEATKAALGAKIRAKKQKDLTLPELRKGWDAQVTDGERDALAAVYRREIGPGREVTAAEAVKYAVHHCFEREAVIPERELVRVALLHGLGDVSAARVRGEFAAQGVLLAERAGRLMATTKEAYGMERFVVNHARAGRGCIEAVGVAAGLERGILDAEQWKAVTSLLSSCDRVQLLDAAAGVGKSTLLSVYDRGMELAGRQATYLATTTPAVGVLRQDGFAAETVAKFLLSDKMQDAARGGTVVVDESSMLGLKDSYRLFAIAKENEINLVFLGDSRQHSSVSAGAFMRTLQQYGGIVPLRITEIKRQKNKQHREAVKLLFEGKTLEGFDILDQKLGWVHEIADADARYDAMAAEYVAALKGGTKWSDILLISPTHAEGQRVTAAIRGRLRQEGLIGKKDQEFTRWVAADLTEAERGDGRNYRPGKVDMIQFHQNAAGHKSGTRLLVGDPASLPLGQAAKFQAYRKETVTFAVNDILRFTANGMSVDGHQIRNGSAYKVAGFTAKGIRLENGWLVAKDFGHFKHGIETSPGSQSKTVSLAIVGQATQSLGAASMEQAYVTASRSRFRVSTYTDDKAALRQAIQRSSLKLAAHDLVNPPAPPQPVPAANLYQQYRQWRDRRRKRQTYLARCRADAEALTRHPPTPPREPTPPTHAERYVHSRQGIGHHHGR